MLRANFPQEWPRTFPKENYHVFYTLNDDTQKDCIETLLDAARRTGRAEYRGAAQRGGDFLLLAQLPEPQPVWAQQYNARMEPAWGRAFEPAAVCSRESGDVMAMLVNLYGARSSTEAGQA